MFEILKSSVINHEISAMKLVGLLILIVAQKFKNYREENGEKAHAEICGKHKDRHTKVREEIGTRMSAVRHWTTVLNTS